MGLLYSRACGYQALWAHQGGQLALGIQDQSTGKRRQECWQRVSGLRELLREVGDGGPLCRTHVAKVWELATGNQCWKTLHTPCIRTQFCDGAASRRDQTAVVLSAMKLTPHMSDQCRPGSTGLPNVSQYKCVLRNVT